MFSPKEEAVARYNTPFTNTTITEGQV